MESEFLVKQAAPTDFERVGQLTFELLNELFPELGYQRDACIATAKILLASEAGVWSFIATQSDERDIGIVMLNGIVLVSYFNHLMASGMPPLDAVVQGALLRLRPVLITAVTTNLGLLPLLLSTGIGSEVQRPLATVVVFGLTTSTLLTLFVIPAVYSLLGQRRRPASAAEPRTEHC